MIFINYALLIAFSAYFWPQSEQTMEDACVFCRIVSGELPASKVYENDEVLAVMDIQPINLGHVLVMPKQCYQHINQMPNDLSHKVFDVVLAVEKALWQTEGVTCQGTNILQNNGEAAWQEVFHVHFHVIPRFETDSFNIRYHASRPSRTALDDLAGRIKKHLTT